MQKYFAAFRKTHCLHCRFTRPPVLTHHLFFFITAGSTEGAESINRRLPKINIFVFRQPSVMDRCSASARSMIRLSSGGALDNMK